MTEADIVAKLKAAKGSVGSVGSVGRGSAQAGRFRPLPEWRPFPVEHLPPVVRGHVLASAQAISCDPAMVAMHALAAVAGAVGNSRSVVLHRKWSEPAVLWTASVVESGSAKSPAMAAAVGPLFELQFDAVEAHRAEVARRNAESLSGEPGSAKRAAGKPAPEPQWITTDTTIETLGEMLRDHPRGLIMAPDELDSWFQSFTRYKGKGGGTDRGQWLNLYGAGRLVVNRITRERGTLFVRRAAVSVTGTIQPAIFARALDRESLQAGLGARILAAMPPKRRKVWSEPPPESTEEAAYAELLADLLRLQPLDSERMRPLPLGLDGGAQRVWRQHYADWSARQQDADGERAAVLAKLEGGAARLALVHHLGTHGGRSYTDPVGEESMRAGVALAQWFACESDRILRLLTEAQEDRDIRSLVEMIQRRNGHRITAREMVRSNSYRWGTSQAAQAALDHLAGLGLGQWAEPAATPHGGQPARYFVLNASDTTDTTDSTPAEPLPDEAGHSPWRV